MGAYLIDYPGTLRQYSARTNWSPSRPTGLTVLHTAESVMDTVGPDTGAEAVADFIRRRSDPGSYHDLCDSDTAVWMVPYEYGAWQDGTGSNGFALSISFACRTTDWTTMSPEKRRGFLQQGARAFARQQAWLREHGYPTTPLRLVTKVESDRGVPGFIYHGHRDPGRRTDPGISTFPFGEFITECRAALAGFTEPEPVQEDDMPLLFTAPGRGVGQLVGDRAIPVQDPESHAGLVAAGCKQAAVSTAQFDAYFRALVDESPEGLVHQVHTVTTPADGIWVWTGASYSHASPSEVQEWERQGATRISLGQRAHEALKAAYTAAASA